MIYLNEFCEHLSSVLNNANNPINYSYDVQAVGYHVDTIIKEKRNVIRVFVSSLGATFNPVYNLGEASYSIPITFYFPVRFKDYFFALDAYLHSYYVGATKFIGENSGSAICNLSGAQYGEIQNIDFKEFKSWADNNYSVPIEVMEPYMSMTLTLYLSTIGESYLYGNEVTSKLSFTVSTIISEEGTLLYDKSKDEGTKKYYYGNGKYYCLEGSHLTYTNPVTQITTEVGYTSASNTEHQLSLTFANGSIQTQSQSADQHLIGDYESEGLPFSTATASSFGVYVEDNYLWKFILRKWFDATIRDIQLTLKIHFGKLDMDFEKPVYLNNLNMPISKGSPLTITLGFAKRLTNGL